MSRSAWTTLSIPGRRTFSATTRPSRSTARWTCEIDAEATGAGSIAREDLRRRPAVLLGQDRLGLGERERPDVVAERRQLGRVGLGEQVGPRAQELAELHERRPEVLADQPEPPRAVVRRDVVPQRHPLERPDEPLQMEGRDDVLIAVTHQASPGSGGSGAGRGDGRRFRGSRSMLSSGLRVRRPTPRAVAQLNRSTPGRQPRPTPGSARPDGR